MNELEVKRLLTQTLATAGDEVRCIAFAGVSGQEGCSTIVASLGEELARSVDGGVLLIDGGIDGADLGARFGLPQSPGMLNLLAGECTLEAAVCATRHAGLSVLPTGDVDDAHRARLRGERFRPLVAELRGSFHTTLIDASSIGIVPEAANLIAAADAAILVLHAEATRLPAALTAVDEMRRVQPRILGAVLNRKRFWLPRWLYRRL